MGRGVCPGMLHSSVVSPVLGSSLPSVPTGAAVSDAHPSHQGWVCQGSRSEKFSFRKITQDTWGRGDFALRHVLNGNIAVKVVLIPAMFGDSFFAKSSKPSGRRGPISIKRTACMFQSWQFPWRDIRQTGAFLILKAISLDPKTVETSLTGQTNSSQSAPLPCEEPLGCRP